MNPEFKTTYILEESLSNGAQAVRDMDYESVPHVIPLEPFNRRVDVTPFIPKSFFYNFNFFNKTNS
jgi:hypothetical protein